MFCLDLGRVIMILNIYGPYQDRVLFWDKVFNTPMLDGRELILGGDFNFSLGSVEVWGPQVVPDVLKKYFLNALVQKDMLEINLVKVLSTLRNRRSGEDWVAKHLDLFCGRMFSGFSGFDREVGH